MTVVPQDPVFVVGPRGPKGEKGDTPGPDDLAPLVNAAITTALAQLPPSVTPQQVNDSITAALAALPVDNDVTLDQLNQAISDALTALPADQVTATAQVQALIDAALAGFTPTVSHFTEKNGRLYADLPIRVPDAQKVTHAFGPVVPNVIPPGMYGTGTATPGNYVDEGYGFPVGEKFYWISGYSPRGPFGGYNPYVMPYDLPADTWDEPIPIPVPENAPLPTADELYGTLFTDVLGDGTVWGNRAGSLGVIGVPAQAQLPQLMGHDVVIFDRALGLGAWPTTAGDPVVFASSYGPGRLIPAGSEIGIAVLVDPTTPPPVADFVAWFQSLSVELRAAAAGQIDHFWWAQVCGLYGFEGGYYGPLDGKIYFAGGDSNLYDPRNYNHYYAKVPDVPPTTPGWRFDASGPAIVATRDLGAYRPDSFGRFWVMQNSAPWQTDPYGDSTDLAVTYQLDCATDEAFTDVVFSETSPFTQSTQNGPALGSQQNNASFDPAQEYFWRAVVTVAKSGRGDAADRATLQPLLDAWVVGVEDVDENGNGPWSASAGRQLFSFDPATNTFALHAPLPVTADFSASGVADGKLYIFPNAGPNWPKPVFGFAYDPQTDAWTKVVNQDVDSFDGNLLVGYMGDLNVGIQHGRSLYFPAAGGMIFDLDTNTFRRVKDPQNDNTDFYTSAVLADDGTIWIAKGQNRDFIADDGVTPISIRRFDPATETWSDGPAHDQINLSLPDPWAGARWFYGYMAAAFTPGDAPPWQRYRQFGASPYVAGYGEQDTPLGGASGPSDPGPIAWYSWWTQDGQVQRVGMDSARRLYNENGVGYAFYSEIPQGGGGGASTADQVTYTDNQLSYLPTSGSLIDALNSIDTHINDLVAADAGVPAEIQSALSQQSVQLARVVHYQAAVTQDGQANFQRHSANDYDWGLELDPSSDDYLMHLGAGQYAIKVAVTLTGLLPNHSYNVRIIFSSSNGAGDDGIIWDAQSDANGQIVINEWLFYSCLALTVSLHVSQNFDPYGPSGGQADGTITILALGGRQGPQGPQGDQGPPGSAPSVLHALRFLVRIAPYADLNAHGFIPASNDPGASELPLTLFDGPLAIEFPDGAALYSVEVTINAQGGSGGPGNVAFNFNLPLDGSNSLARRVIVNSTDQYATATFLIPTRAVPQSIENMFTVDMPGPSPSGPDGWNPNVEMDVVVRRLL